MAILTKSERVESDVAEFLDVVRLCDQLHVLPRAGGLMDQDALFVHLYKKVSAATAERQAFDQRNSERKAASANKATPRRHH